MSAVHALPKYLLIDHLTLKLQIVLKMYSIKCVTKILSIKKTHAHAHAQTHIHIYIHSRISKIGKIITL